MLAYAFLLPAFIFFVIFLLYPVIRVGWDSLHGGSILSPGEFVGLENWANAFSDPVAQKALVNTGKYAVIAIPGMLTIGMILALFLLNIRRGAQVLRAAVYFPTLAPVVIAAIVWLFLIHPEVGILNQTLQALGREPIAWLGNPSTALPTIAAVEIWRASGFWAVFFLASLLGLPEEIIQAAHLDGANAFQRFAIVVLPLLRPVILFAVVMATIWNLQIFDSVFVLTDGAPGNATATVVWYIYKSLFVFDKLGFGATLSFVLLTVILALSLIQVRLLTDTRTSKT